MSLFLSIIAIVISLLAIILTVVQIRIQLKHNLISVQPIGTIDVSDFDNDVSVCLGNAGVGPLIIESVKVFNKVRSSNNLLDVLPDDLVNSITWTNFVSELEGRAIRPGDCIYLVHAQFPDEAEMDSNLISSRQILRDSLKKITVEFTYRDIYNKSTHHEKRALTWFARNDK